MHNILQRKKNILKKNDITFLPKSYNLDSSSTVLSYSHKRDRFVKITKKNVNKFLFVLKADGIRQFDVYKVHRVIDYKMLKLRYLHINSIRFRFFKKKTIERVEKLINNVRYYFLGLVRGTKKKRLTFSEQKTVISLTSTNFNYKTVAFRSGLQINYSLGVISRKSLKDFFYTRVTNKREWALMKKYSKKSVNRKRAQFSFNYKTRHLTKFNWIFDTVPLFFLEQSKGSKQFGHPFHLVSPSILPLTVSFGFFCIFQNFLGFIWFDSWHSFLVLGLHSFLFINMFSIVLTWVLEIFSEEQSGSHTLEVQKGFQYAILLFILSELMLFVSFFWAYFHFSLNSNSFTGGTFTPKGLVIFYWYRIPLLNTLLLLSSGLSLTIGHILLVEWDKYLKAKLWIKLLSFHTYELISSSLLLDMKNCLHRVESLSVSQRQLYLVDFRGGWNTMYGLVRTSNDLYCCVPLSYLLKIKGVRSDSLWLPNYWILDTVLKGFVFLIYQAYEYSSSMFSINDSVYGAVFFSLTGLHGLHVLIGVTFLFTYLVVHFRQTFTKKSYKLGRMYVYTDRGVTLKPSYFFNYWSHRIAFDGAAWYWHFVDVVWFFVFLFIYWWGFVDVLV